MASRRQIAANRRNAQKSTGPRTAAGKLRSRRNALKHGLTAETVVTVFENEADYQAFENVMVRQYRPGSEIERQLVVRLASLFWRLRRATAIETGLFQIQGQIIADWRANRSRHENDGHKSTAKLYKILDLTADQKPKAASAERLTLQSACERSERVAASDDRKNDARKIGPKVIAIGAPAHTKEACIGNERARILAHCFMRVARLDDKILERLSRYEVAMWRQAAQLAQILRMSKRRQNQAPKKYP